MECTLIWGGEKFTYSPLHRQMFFGVELASGDHPATLNVLRLDVVDIPRYMCSATWEVKADDRLWIPSATSMRPRTGEMGSGVLK